MTHIQVVESRNGEIIVIDCMRTFTGHFCYTVKQKHDHFPDELTVLATGNIVEDNIVEEEFVDEALVEDEL